MSITIPVVSASGATSTVTLPDPTVGTTTGVQPYWARWANGPKWATSEFPVGAWLVALHSWAIDPYPNLGAAVRDAGVNLIIGTWDWLSSVGRPYVQIAKDQGLKLIPSPDTIPDLAYIAANPDHASVITGWLLGDEFDMFGPEAPQVKANYTAAAGRDPSRPVHVNWGKGIGAVPGLSKSYSRESDSSGTQYLQSCDSTSVDYYWWTDTWESQPNAFGYGRTIDSMRRFARLAGKPDLPMMGMVETSRVSSSAKAITATQLEAAVWSMIVHGARGVAYFVHDFGTSNSGGQEGLWSPKYGDKAGAQAIIASMKKVNGRLQSLAPILNSPPTGAVDSNGREQLPPGFSVASTGNIPVDVMVRKVDGRTYVFAQASGDSSHLASGATTATFSAPSAATVTVRDENRAVAASGNTWTDTFNPYGFHLYVL